MGDVPRPVPITDSRSEAWFDAASKGKLLVQRCRACCRNQFYPRRHCTSCFSTHVDWLEASGKGRLHTFSVVHFTPNEPFVADTPYVFGIIELDEGVRITSRVIGTDPEELRCDMRVKAIFERAKADPTILPLFAVAQEGA